MGWQWEIHIINKAYTFYIILCCISQICMVHFTVYHPFLLFNYVKLIF